MSKFNTLAASVIAAALLLAPTALAADRATLCERAYGVRKAVIAKHGERAPGRNICRWGVKSRFNPKWSKPATTRQKARYLRALRALNRPPVRALTSAGGPRVQPAGTLSPRLGAGHPLAAIRACESGGNYGAVSPGGHYRGAYQFDYRTWASVGGVGDPAAASPAEQDKRAAMLYERRGAQPWPVCGR